MAMPRPLNELSQSELCQVIFYERDAVQSAYGKIRADFLYLKLLLDLDALAPEWRPRVVARLEDTVKDYRQLF